MWTQHDFQAFLKAVETVPESSRKVEVIAEVMKKPLEEVACSYERFIQMKITDAQIVQNSAWSVKERQRFQFTFSMIPNTDEKIVTLSTFLKKPIAEVQAHLTELHMNTSPPMESYNSSMWSFEDMHRCELAMSKIPIGIEDRLHIIATIIDKPLKEVVHYCSLFYPNPTLEVLDQSIIPFVPEKNSGHWTAAEHDIFVQALETCRNEKGVISWKAMSEIVKTRTSRQIKDHYDKVVKGRN